MVKCTYIYYNPGYNFDFILSNFFFFLFYYHICVCMYILMQSINRKGMLMLKRTYIYYNDTKNSDDPRQMGGYN